MRCLLLAAALALAALPDVQAKAGRAGWHSSLINARVLQATPSPSPSSSGTPSVMSTTSATASASPSSAASIAASASSSMAPSASNSGTGTPTTSVTRSVTSTNTRTATRTSTSTITTTPTPSLTVGASPSNTPSISITRTPSITATGSPSALSTVTASTTPLPSRSAGAAASSSPQPPAIITVIQVITLINPTRLGNQITNLVRIRIAFTITIWRAATNGFRPNCYISRLVGKTTGTVVTFSRTSDVNSAPITRRLESLWESTGATTEAEAIAAVEADTSVMGHLNHALARFLQSSADEDVDVQYEVEVPPANVVDDGTGSAVRTAQNATAQEVLSAIQTATSTGALEMAMGPVLTDVAVSAGLPASGVTTSVDVTSAQITFGSASTATASPTGLGGGAVAGIVIGVIAFVAIVAIIAYLVTRKPKQRVGDAGAHPPAPGGDSTMV